jgi:hypothetical protein
MNLMSYIKKQAYVRRVSYDGGHKEYCITVYGAV